MILSSLAQVPHALGFLIARYHKWKGGHQALITFQELLRCNSLQRTELAFQIRIILIGLDARLIVARSRCPDLDRFGDGCISNAAPLTCHWPSLDQVG